MTPTHRGPEAPPALRRGDVAAIVSPSAPAAGRFPSRLAQAVGALTDLGLRVRVMPHATDDDGLTAGTVASRVADLHDAFADEEVRAIITAIGGHLSSQLVSVLDWDRVRANPKIFCGFSDTTTLHLALLRHAGLSSFYGPAALPSWGELPAPHAETVASFEAVAFATPWATGDLGPVRTTAADVRDWADDGPRSYVAARSPGVVRPGTAVGRLLPACLPVLGESIGTSWEPVTAGCILVLDLPPWPYALGDLATDIWHLRNAGLLDDVAMVATTTPDPRSRLDGLAEVLIEAVPDPSVPIAIDIAMGHSSPMLTVPIGRLARWEHPVVRLLESPTAPR